MVHKKILSHVLKMQCLIHSMQKKTFELLNSKGKEYRVTKTNHDNYSFAKIIGTFTMYLQCMIVTLCTTFTKRVPTLLSPIVFCERVLNVLNCSNFGIQKLQGNFQ